MEEATTNKNDFCPLDNITPLVSVLSLLTEMHNTITVQPALLPQQAITQLQPVQHAKPKAQPKISVEGPRSQRISQTSWELEPQAQLALFAEEEDEEPQTLTKVLSGNRRDEWKVAWESELETLATNHPWAIEPLPADPHAIGCRWLYKKTDDGRYKAHLVAKRYS